MNNQYNYITKTHLHESCELLLDSFHDDSYFVKISKRLDMHVTLYDLFYHSVAFCIDNGIAYGCFENDRLIAISLWFDYNRTKQYFKDDFKRLFSISANEVEFLKFRETVDSHIDECSNYLYLLLIAVSHDYRNQGIGCDLVRRVKNCYCEYNVFSDVSNKNFAQKLLQTFGFLKVGDFEGCQLLEYQSYMNDEISSFLQQEQIAVILPKGFCEKIFLNICPFEIFVSNLKNTPNSPLFSRCLDNEKISCDYVLLSRNQFYNWQQVVNPLLCEEVIITIDDKKAIVYIHSVKTNYQHLRYEWRMVEDIKLHSTEWAHVADIYTLIPMSYDSPIKMSCISDMTINVRRLLRALDFRTKYESGTLINEKLNTSFSHRIDRAFLELCHFQLYDESKLSFDEPIFEDAMIGEPIAVALILSYDKYTSCSVLEIILLSSGLFPTQYLDSISRNQIYIVKEDGKINIYEYLEKQYGLHKRGVPKNYINFHEHRSMIDDDFLASVLYCETYYQNGEALGKVIDPNIINQIQSEHGRAQYNYASAYFHTNSVIHISDNLDSLKNRIIEQSVTLFYIEMILYEESAIEIMNHNVIKFLTEIELYSHRALIRVINSLLNEHLKTIAFWGISMNYPSSNRSLNIIRQAFNIEAKRIEVERNKKQLISIAQLRENYLSYVESRIVSTLGVILTILSIAEFIIDPMKSSHLIYIGIIAVIVWLYIQRRLTMLKK